jgi:hypothetical protein
LKASLESVVMKVDDFRSNSYPVELNPYLGETQT